MSFILIPILDRLLELSKCSSFLSLQPSLAEGMHGRGSSSVLATTKEKKTFFSFLSHTTLSLDF